MRAAASQIGNSLDGYTVVVTKSTVPVGTGEDVERIIRGLRPDIEFDVVSNPEFLREGSAIEDFMRPDRVVVGCETKKAKEVILPIVESGKEVHLNLKDVSYMDSSGISVLIESHQKALEKNTKVVVKEVSKSVLKVIMMAKLEQILNLE